MQHITLIVILFFCGITTPSCNKPTVEVLTSEPSYQISEGKALNKFNPPNTLRINDTLLVDKTEITNIGYKEFLNWCKMTMDEKSNSYKSLIPLNLGTFSFTGGYEEIAAIEIEKVKYMWSEEYNYYPVIDITLQQALKFTQWRSDRVFEMILKKNGILKPGLYFENEVFTIDAFLKSEVYRKHKDIITHYPQYYIPSKKDYLNLLSAISNKKDKQAPSPSQEEIDKHFVNKGLLILPSKLSNNEGIDNQLYLLNSNVSEITTEGLAFGGNYTSTNQVLDEHTFYNIKLPSQMVGFRNFCKWVPIEDILTKSESNQF